MKGRIENTQILEEVGLETEEISEKKKKIKNSKKGLQFLWSYANI